MKNIVVNASAAKGGGAEVIVRTFVDNIKVKEGYKYIIISPIKFSDLPLNVHSIYLKTSGIGSIVFSTLGIFYFLAKFRAKKIISFNNINCIFFTNRGITYFHQLKALDNYRELKVKIYNFFIKKFLKKNYFIVQTEQVKMLFLKEYPMLKENQVLSSWPGFFIPSSKGNMIKFKRKPTFKYVGVLPVSYESDHKNIDFLFTLESYFEKRGIHIITLLNQNTSRLRNCRVFSNIGEILREDLFELYSECDFLIFTSKTETVGLPIFEFLQTGRPAFVLKAPYSVSLFQQFDSPRNFCLFESEDDFKIKFEENINVFDDSHDYSKGEWHKIHQLL